MNDEKYLKLTGNNALGNRYFYSTDSVTAPSKVNFQCKSKSMDMSSKDSSNHEIRQAINQETWLKECIDKKLLLEWKLFV